MVEIVNFTRPSLRDVPCKDDVQIFPTMSGGRKLEWDYHSGREKDVSTQTMNVTDMENKRTDRMVTVHCVRKKETNSILYITLTNSNSSLYFLAKQCLDSNAKLIV